MTIFRSQLKLMALVVLLICVLLEGTASAAPSNYKQVRAAKGWTHFKAKPPQRGSSEAEFVVLKDLGQLDRAPLPKAIRDDIRKSVATTRSGGQGLVIVNKTLADKGVSQTRGCRSFNWGKSYPWERNFDWKKSGSKNGFSGKINFDGKLRTKIGFEASAKASGAFCVWIVLNKFVIDASAKADFTATVEGGFSDEWSEQKEVLNPTLLDTVVWIGPYPLWLTVKLPLEVGLEVEAKVQANLKADFNAEAHYKLTCTPSGCTKRQGASHDFDFKSPNVAYDVNARARLSPWIQPNVEVGLYRKVAWGRAGVRATLNADAWVYAGNKCGDADRDGKNETVYASTVDARLDLDLVGKVGFFGKSKDIGKKIKTFKLGMFSFGKASALDPMLYSAGSSGNSLRIAGGMRPCWPYKDKLKYKVDWGDGKTDRFETGKRVSKSHKYKKAKSYAIKLKVEKDRKGRSLNRVTTRKLRVLSGPGKR